MSATNAEKTVKANHRTREHRFSKMPFRDVMKITMEEKKISNPDMQLALGYSKPNVIAMIKGGSMALSPEKAPIVAKVLGLDPLFVLRKLTLEHSPILWDAIESVIGKKMVTDNEVALLNIIRKELDGFDADLAGDDKFVQTVTPLLKSIAVREAAVAQASLDRLERQKSERAAKRSA